MSEENLQQITESHLQSALTAFRNKNTDNGLLALTMALQSLSDRIGRIEDELLVDPVKGGRTVQQVPVEK